MTPHRLQRVHQAVQRWASMDPSAWNTGLSEAGCRLAQSVASKAILSGQFQQPQNPPKKTPGRREGVILEDRVFFWSGFQ